MIENRLASLREKVKGYMSEARFKHTLGVEQMAMKLSEHFLPEKREELCAAAILHDVAKEISREEQLFLIKTLDFKGCDLTNENPSCYHAFASVELIKRDFPDFACEDILSSTFKHTTGYTDMTVFDKIIFISDYIEYGRTYPSCVELRRWLLENLTLAKAKKDKELLLNKAVLRAMDNTLFSLKLRNAQISNLTLLARDSISALI